jgi:uncharacterized membrane protein YdjX (TVP38/TMEM64 family)
LADLVKERSLRNAKIGAVVAVVVGLVVAQRLGVFEELSDLARVTHTLNELGPWGYVAFVVAYAVFQPFGIPGTVFVMAASLIWPWPIAFTLSMVGTMAASTVGFSFARFVARDWVSGFIPARFRKYNEALARRAFTTVFTLRIIFWMPPLLHAFFGVSQVRFWTHFWGSLVGYVAPLLLMSIFGPKLFEMIKHAPPQAWAAAVVGAAAIALGVWAWRRRRAPVEAEPAAPVD